MIPGAPARIWQVNDSYHAMRPLHLFLAILARGWRRCRWRCRRSFQRDRRPADAALGARSDGAQAFVFVNNYQRLEGLPDQAAVQFQLQLSVEMIFLPARPVAVAGGAWFFWPVNFDLDGLRLKYASAQPVCRVSTGEGPLYVLRPSRRSNGVRVCGRRTG